MLPDPERLDETEYARMKGKRVACLAAGLLAMAGLVDAQDKVPSVYFDGKVANFALPGHDYSSPGFESLSFWSGPHGKAIDYEYGADQKRVRLRAIGPDGNDEGFAVRFPNGLVLDVVPQGTALHVSDRSEEHTSELQSLMRISYAVFCLKKKKA